MTETYNTICLEKTYSCPLCQGKIRACKIKSFDNFFEKYQVKDCIAHAEEIRIIKEDLFCDLCSKRTGRYIYIIVNRGILIGIADTLEEARRQLDDLNLEKLIFWYHDLYKILLNERREKNSYIIFLKDMLDLYGSRQDDVQEQDTDEDRVSMIWNLKHFMGSRDPVESIKRFMIHKNVIKALDDLWEEGHKILEIYWSVESHDPEIWSMQVYQDEINKRCRLDWTWRVVSKQQLKAEDRKESQQPDRVIVVDAFYTNDLILDSVKKWLRKWGYEFSVRSC